MMADVTSTADLVPPDHPHADVVVVVGAAGPLGVAVVARLVADPAVGRVVAIDRVGHRSPASSTSVDVVVGDVVGASDGQLDTWLDGADVVIHLAPTTADGPGVDGTATRSFDLPAFDRLLRSATRAGVGQLVLLSTGMAYGAWTDNPMPITEAAELRPNRGLRFAEDRAGAEASLASWRSLTGAVAATVRPTVVVAFAARQWFVGSPWSMVGLKASDIEVPAQFLLLDDLAAAVDAVRRARFDGAANVAPDGWISPDLLPTLSGPGRRFAVPRTLALAVERLRWRLGASQVPPEALPWVVHPWVLANDVVRSCGWEPSATNEEAYVEVDAGGRWASMSARRRQELSLSASVLAVVGLGLGIRAVLGARRR